MSRKHLKLWRLAPTALSLGIVALGAPLIAPAQQAPAPASSTRAAQSMPADHPMPLDHSKPADHDDMANMDSMSDMKMGPMQGGRAPADARSPDYSAGIGYGSMKGMDMADNARLGYLLIDQLEQFHGRDSNGQFWEAEGWYGNDRDKLWLRTEGERSRGTLEEADVEAFWHHYVATYWGTQVGARQDFGVGPERTWGAVGLQGLAPYWFEVEATAYVGAGGRTAARLRAEYDLFFTQRLILQPEAELNAYGKSDPQRRLGSGISDVQIGLRLRYEIRRELAPYIGISWNNLVGGTADYARVDHQPATDLRILVGLRAWY